MDKKLLLETGRRQRRLINLCRISVRFNSRLTFMKLWYRSYTYLKVSGHILNVPIVQPLIRGKRDESTFLHLNILFYKFN